MEATFLALLVNPVLTTQRRKMEKSSPPSSSLYPKITQHIHEVVKELKRQNRDPEDPEKEVILDPIPIIGTVKLHGTHADIVVHNNDGITFQSRNNPNLLATADNYAFAISMTPKRNAILSLRCQYLDRWRKLNPSKSLDPDLPVTLAGEWIGEKIQKDVAISSLSKRFVIVSVRINGDWVPDAQYADIEAPGDDIYNISRGGVYRSTLYPENPQQTVLELEELAEKVAARCPFAASFDVVGEGEGLVWKLEPFVEKSELWFKTKGGRFKPTFTPGTKTLNSGTDAKREAAATVAKAWCNKLRLEQGWDYLRECRVTRDMKATATFLKWVENDILVEEKGYIEDEEVDKKILKQESIAIAKPWFLERFGKGDDWARS